MLFSDKSLSTRSATSLWPTAVDRHQILASGPPVRARWRLSKVQSRLAGLMMRELEWNDARNGSNNLPAALPRCRSDSRYDRHILCFVDAGQQCPAAAGGPCARGAAARLGGDL